MEPVVGVFATRQEAEEATERLSQRGLGQITLLTPDDWKQKVHTVRTADMERPGIGAALCGLVGGGLGVAAGLELGALAAATAIAGGNPAVTLELLGAVILGVGDRRGTPRAAISSHIPPAPIPRTTRPPEIVDSPVTVRARMGAGRLSRLVMITAPVMLLVAPRTNPNAA